MGNPVNYIILWKKELLAGILFISWFAAQWALVIWVWTDGELTLIIGFPIIIIGVLALIYGIRHISPYFLIPNRSIFLAQFSSAKFHNLRRGSSGNHKIELWLRPIEDKIQHEDLRNTELAPNI